MDKNGFSGNSRRADNIEFWQLAVALQAASGQSMSEFCRREGLIAKTFYKWKQHLSCRDTDAASSAAANRRGAAGGGSTFVPVRVRPDDLPRCSNPQKPPTNPSPVYRAAAEAPHTEPASAIPSDVELPTIELRTRLSNQRVVVIQAAVQRPVLVEILSALEALSC